MNLPEVESKSYCELDHQGMTSVELAMIADQEFMADIVGSILSEEANKIFQALNTKIKNDIKKLIAVRAEKFVKRGVGRPRKSSPT